MAQFNMGIGLNTGDVQAGAKRATNALEDISDSLDDLGRDGEKGGEKVEEALRDAQREAKDTSRSFKQVAQDAERSFDDIRRDSRSTFSDVGDNADRGMGRARESVQGFKEEGIQNFSEFASSTQGDFQSVADGVQGLTGGLASSMPGIIGIPVAAAGAIVAGIASTVTSAIEKMKADTEAAFEDMTESGNNFVSAEFYNNKIKDILNDDSLIKLAKQQSDALGLPIKTIIEAMAGYPPAQAEVDAAIDRNNAKLEENSDGWTNLTEAQRKQFDANQRTKEQMDATNQSVDAATSKAKIYNDASKEVTSGLNAQADANKKNADSIRNTPDGKTVKITVQEDGSLSSIERRLKQIGNGVRVPIGTSAGKFGAGQL